MANVTEKPLYFYISGPYSPPSEAVEHNKGGKIIEENIRMADDIARAIAAKGHFPFVPHTMLRGWEDIHKMPRKLIMNICHNWIERCDALYFIANSVGADSERQIAVQLDLPVYEDLKDIPEVTLDKQ